jgi:hypothetical protein
LQSKLEVQACELKEIKQRLADALTGSISGSIQTQTLKDEILKASEALKDENLKALETKVHYEELIRNHDFAALERLFVLPIFICHKYKRFTLYIFCKNTYSYLKVAKIVCDTIINFGERDK